MSLVMRVDGKLILRWPRDKLFSHVAEFSHLFLPRVRRDEPAAELKKKWKIKNNDKELRGNETEASIKGQPEGAGWRSPRTEQNEMGSRLKGDSKKYGDSKGCFFLKR